MGLPFQWDTLFTVKNMHFLQFRGFQPIFRHRNHPLESLALYPIPPKGFALPGNSPKVVEIPVGRSTSAANHQQIQDMDVSIWPFISYNWLLNNGIIHSINGLFLVLITGISRCITRALTTINQLPASPKMVPHLVNPTRWCPPNVM